MSLIIAFIISLAVALVTATLLDWYSHRGYGFIGRLIHNLGITVFVLSTVTAVLIFTAGVIKVIERVL